MDLTIASRTDVGRIRTNNEDNYHVDMVAGLFIVSDGMGGHNAGEVASKLSCDVISREIDDAQALRERYDNSGDTQDLKALRKIMENAVGTACKEIYRQASRSEDQAGMGTTCTAVWFVGNNKGIIGHVGDSRLYVLRSGNLHQLSEDHTYVNELVKRSALSKEEAKNHPQGNVLSRALGVQPTVSVDTMIFDVDPGDTYLLCSDGLYNYYQENQEIAALLNVADLNVSLKNLIDRALERGGHDNCTAIAVRVGGAPPSIDSALAADQRIAILKRIRIFSYLTYNELVKVLGLTHLTAAAAGAYIITEGERGDELYVVLSGSVEIIKGGASIATLQAGVHLGEMAMIDNAPRSATVRALEDVNLLVMRREEFFNLIRTEPAIASKLLWSFVQVLSGRLRETNEALQGARKGLNDNGETFEIFMDDDE